MSESVRCAHEIVAAYAAAGPDRVAVVADGLSTTYGELNRAANRIAALLVRRGVRPGDTVGLLLPRSAEFVAATLGVLKAGAAYVPLDPQYPTERLHLMVTTAGCATVLTTPGLRDRVPAGVAAECPGDSHTALPDTDPAVPVHPDDVAYTMFTSGSTGVPKGVLVTHRGVVGLLHGDGMVRLEHDDAVLHASSVSFDASTFDIWGALLNGARLVVATEPKPSVVDIGRLVRAHGVTTALLPTGLFHLMVDERLGDLATLRCVVAGGDVLSSVHARRFTDGAPGVCLVNAYGPTEATVASTVHPVPPGHDSAVPVPIGRAVRQARLHVLDDLLREVPAGAAGQLYVGGGGLARGYTGDPALTAERFVPDPRVPGARLYATGDLVRSRPDGVLEFLGRVDDQVKKRGYRIEPGEVETALRADPAVRDAAVLLAGATADTRRLVAAVVPRDDGDLAGLPTRLARVLPEYLLPDSIVAVEELPVTANGKIDRAALVGSVAAAAPEPAEPEPGAVPIGVEPADPDETALAAIWTEVLELDRAGRDDDFFDLGGHSLLANRVVAQVRKRLGVTLSLDAVFDHPTIAELAVQVRLARS